MNEEFDGLLNELLGEEEPEAPETETPEAEPAEEPAEEPEAEPEAEEIDGEPDTAELSEPTQEEKANKAFAEMRAKNTKYEKALKKAADQAGLSLDEYVEQLEAKALERQAKKQGVDPELLRRLEDLESQNARYRDLEVQVYLQREFDTLEKQLGVTKKELQQFTGDLLKRGHDFRNMSVDYKMLYKGLYHDQLVEKERQAWIARRDKGETGSTTVSKKGKTDPSASEEVETMEALDRLLSEIPD